MIIYKVLPPFLIFVTSELAENVYDPCSEFLNYFGTPLVRCQSEKQDSEYLECYDLEDKEYFEKIKTNGYFDQKYGLCTPLLNVLYKREYLKKDENILILSNDKRNHFNEKHLNI